jgi:hypothetical protein
VRIKLTVSLPDTGSWFAPRKDASGIMRLEIPATEFSEVIQLSRFMDCYTKGGKTFTAILTDEE